MTDVACDIFTATFKTSVIGLSKAAAAKAVSMLRKYGMHAAVIGGVVVLDHALSPGQKKRVEHVSQFLGGKVRNEYEQHEAHGADRLNRIGADIQHARERAAQERDPHLRTHHEDEADELFARRGQLLDRARYNQGRFVAGATHQRGIAMAQDPEDLVFHTNLKHDPHHNKDRANHHANRMRYHAEQAAAARKGGRFFGPNEKKAKFHDEMVQKHAYLKRRYENLENSPEYQKEEAEHHRQEQRAYMAKIKDIGDKAVTHAAHANYHESLIKSKRAPSTHFAFACDSRGHALGLMTPIHHLTTAWHNTLGKGRMGAPRQYVNSEGVSAMKHADISKFYHGLADKHEADQKSWEKSSIPGAKLMANIHKGRAARYRANGEYHSTQKGEMRVSDQAKHEAAARKYQRDNEGKFASFNEYGPGNRQLRYLARREVAMGILTHLNPLNIDNWHGPIGSVAKGVKNLVSGSKKPPQPKKPKKPRMKKPGSLLGRVNDAVNPSRVIGKAVGLKPASMGLISGLLNLTGGRHTDEYGRSLTGGKRVRDTPYNRRITKKYGEHVIGRVGQRSVAGHYDESKHQRDDSGKFASFGRRFSMGTSRRDRYLARQAAAFADDDAVVDPRLDDPVETHYLEQDKRPWSYKFPTKAEAVAFHAKVRRENAELAAQFNPEWDNVQLRVLPDGTVRTQEPASESVCKALDKLARGISGPMMSIMGLSDRAMTQCVQTLTGFGLSCDANADSIDVEQGADSQLVREVAASLKGRVVVTGGAQSRRDRYLASRR